MTIPVTAPLDLRAKQHAQLKGCRKWRQRWHLFVWSRPMSIRADHQQTWHYICRWQSILGQNTSSTKWQMFYRHGRTAGDLGAPCLSGLFINTCITCNGAGYSRYSWVSHIMSYSLNTRDCVPVHAYYNYSNLPNFVCLQGQPRFQM